MTTPPPECPAHSSGGAAPGGLTRLYGPEVDADPEGLYEKLRAEYGPVAPVLLLGEQPAWLVVGHNENLEVLRNPSRFSRDSRIWNQLKDGKVPMDWPLLPVVAWQPVCVFADGVEHDRLRGAVTNSLGRLNRRGIRQYITRFANQLVDEICQSGRADLVSQFAEQLPMLVMTQLLGMPEEEGPRLVKALRDMLMGTETAIASNEYVMRLCTQLAVRKRADPGGDLASLLGRDDAGLTDEEIAEHLRLVLVAANETTVNLIASGLKMVLTDPRFRAHLNGGQMTLPDALEQVLWDEPPMAAVLGRWATGDTVLAGQQIKAGDMLMLGLAAGNVDPRVRPDLNASLYGNRSHLAFSSGPHECPGQDIGRAIADTGIDTLLMRLPDLHLAVEEGELRSRAAFLSRHMVDLPVKFSPRKPMGEQLPTPRTPQAQPPAAEMPPAQPEPIAAAAPVGAPVPRQRRSRWSALTSWFRGR
ncbi:cytochrome P450 [Actinacidiphila soli]|uniref:cytochrome P450 n=1 Tax=Actinacidiphila soli TaxID=2487275 RepID=UPI000FCA77BC|nr:cytochrome P450 [Actinacidiphila soli]